MTKTVYIIEDDLMTSFALQKLAYENMKADQVDTYAFGNLALIRKEHIPSVIILDLGLPDVRDPLQYVAKLTQLFPESRIIVYSRDRDPIMQKNMANLGVSQYIEKGYDGLSKLKSLLQQTG